MLRKSQLGRSMIEMLGVLAIIGVLSVGGLAGYSKAMHINKINNITSYANRALLEFKALQASGQLTPTKPYPCANYLDENMPLGMNCCQFQDNNVSYYNNRLILHFETMDLLLEIAEKLRIDNMGWAKTKIQSGDLDLGYAAILSTPSGGWTIYPFSVGSCDH